MESDRSFDGEILDGPTMECDEAGLAGDDAAGWDRDDVRAAVSARDWEQFRIRIHREPGADVRSVFADFAGIDRGADGVDFNETGGGGGSDDAGKNEFAGAIDFASTFRGELLADLFDFPVFDQQVGIFDAPTG